MKSQLETEDDFGTVLRGVAAAPSRQHRDGQVIGHYRVASLIGVGGMGSVYEARDTALGRAVAMKFVNASSSDRDRIHARFAHERAITAELEHPSIIPVYDSGETSDGEPFYVMRIARGEPLDRRIVGATSAAARLALLPNIIAVADAVAFAHGRGIVHRDLKPANILVGAFGETLVADWGLAKRLGDAEPSQQLATGSPDSLSMTRTGHVLGTPAYMAPEQGEGRPADERSDVYAIGAMLYQLVANRPPTKDRTQLAEAPADLRAIISKSLSDRPGDRYQSAGELAAELRRFIGGQIVVARTYTRRELFVRWLRQHRREVVVGGVLGALLVALAIVSVVRIADQRDRAITAQVTAESARKDLLRERGVQELAAGYSGRALPYFAEVLRDGGDSAPLRLLIAEAMRPLSRESAMVEVKSGTIGIAWSPDGSSFVVTGMSSTAELYNVDGTALRSFASGASELLQHPVFSHDGTMIAAADNRGTVWLWDAATSAIRWQYHGTSVLFLALTSDNSTLVVVAYDGSMLALDARTGAVRARSRAAPNIGWACPVALSPDDRHLAVGNGLGEVRVWDFVANAFRVFEGQTGAVTALRFSHDGKRLYSGGADHALRVLDAATGSVLALLVGHDEVITAIDLDRTDAHLVASGADDTAVIWDLATNKIVSVLGGVPNRGIRWVHANGDGTHLVTIGGDGTFRLWDGRGNPEVVLEGTTGAGEARHSTGASAVDAQFSPDGTRLLIATSHQVRVYHVDRSPLLAERIVDASPYAISWSPDDAKLAITGGRIAGVWDVAFERQLVSIDQAGKRFWDLSFSPDGTKLSVAGDDGVAAIRGADGTLLAALRGHRGIVNRAEWSPDGARLVTAGDDHTARVWSATGTPELVLPHDDRVLAAAWRHDRAQIATACWDRKLRLWDAVTGRLMSTIDSGGMQLLDVSFSPDGRRLAASGHGGDVKVWTLATDAKPIALEGHTDAVSTVAWSPDGALLATAGYDGTARIWDPNTGEQLATRPTGMTMSLAWSHDGARIATASEDGYVRVWDVHRSSDPAEAIFDFVKRRAGFRLAGTQIERSDSR